METSASFEARYAPLLYPTNQVNPALCRLKLSALFASGRPCRAEHGASLDTAIVESSALQSRTSYASLYVSVLPLKESVVARFRPRILQCSEHHYYGLGPARSRGRSQIPGTRC